MDCCNYINDENKITLKKNKDYRELTNSDYDVFKNNPLVIDNNITKPVYVMLEYCLRMEKNELYDNFETNIGVLCNDVNNNIYDVIVNLTKYKIDKTYNNSYMDITNKIEEQTIIVANKQKQKIWKKYIKRINNTPTNIKIIGKYNNEVCDRLIIDDCEDRFVKDHNARFCWMITGSLDIIAKITKRKYLDSIEYDTKFKYITYNEYCNSYKNASDPGKIISILSFQEIKNMMIKEIIGKHSDKCYNVIAKLNIEEANYNTNTIKYNQNESIKQLEEFMPKSLSCLVNSYPVCDLIMYVTDYINVLLKNNNREKVEKIKQTVINLNIDPLTGDDIVKRVTIKCCGLPYEYSTLIHYMCMGYGKECLYCNDILEANNINEDNINYEKIGDNKLEELKKIIKKGRRILIIKKYNTKIGDDECLCCKYGNIKIEKYDYDGVNTDISDIVFYDKLIKSQEDKIISNNRESLKNVWKYEKNM